MTQPLESGQLPPQEALVSHEKLLPGTKAVVTGGSRDIGAAIVKTLATQGTEVISSFNNKQKRADKVAAEVEEAGGKAHFLQADISTPEGRSGFVEGALGIAPEIDFLVLNTSGDTAALNQEASDDLVTQFLPHMKEGGTIVRLQSVPGRYAPQLRGLGKMISIYDEVAERKYEDVQNLRKRIPALAEKGVRFLEVTPPVVEGTSNMMLFNMAAKRETGGTKTAEEMHDEISDKLGLPRKVTQEQVADEILDLFIRWDVPSGHTEFFNGVEDVQTKLEMWYEPAQVGVQTLERTDIYGVPMGVGRAIVSKEQIEMPGEPPLLDEIRIDENGEYTGVITIQPEHAIGHLNTENGYPSLFAGHKSIAASAECIEQIERGLGNSHFSRIRGFEKAVFERGVIADGSQTLTIKPQVLMRTEEEAMYNVVITNQDGVVTTRIEGLEMRYEGSWDDANALPQSFIIEAAAQTAGVTLVDEIGDEVMPLFREVGRTSFADVRVKAGAGLQYAALGERTKSGIQGAVRVTSGGEFIAEVNGINALVAPRKVAFRMIGYKPNI